MTRRDARNAFEKDYISRKLREHHWNISRTADDLKIKRSHLHRKIKLLDVEMAGGVRGSGIGPVTSVLARRAHLFV